MTLLYRAQQLSRNIVYAITFKLPTPGIAKYIFAQGIIVCVHILGEDFVLRQLQPIANNTEIYLLGWSTNQTLSYRYEEGSGLQIKIPNIAYGLLKHAWTFVLSFVDVP